jgi:hypothetical protein
MVFHRFFYKKDGLPYICVVCHAFSTKRKVFHKKIDLKIVYTYTCMEWKAFGSYYVSNDGKVKRNKKELKLWIRPNGYYQVNLSENGKHKWHLVHRLVLTLFKGECPDGYECDHIDRNRINNHIDNLRWVTRYENNMNRCVTRTDITETDPKKRRAIFDKEYQKKYYEKLGKKKQTGCISITNNRYQARIMINKIRYIKTFTTRDEAQAFIDSKIAFHKHMV